MPSLQQEKATASKPAPMDREQLRLARLARLESPNSSGPSPAPKQDESKKGSLLSRDDLKELERVLVLEWCGASRGRGPTASFVVRRSSFVVHRSSFVVRRSSPSLTRAKFASIPTHRSQPPTLHVAVPDERHNSATTLVARAQRLVKIISNATSGDDERFKRLKYNNVVVQREILACPPSEKLLRAVGWTSLVEKNERYLVWSHEPESKEAQLASRLIERLKEIEEKEQQRADLKEKQKLEEQRRLERARNMLDDDHEARREKQARMLEKENNNGEEENNNGDEENNNNEEEEEENGRRR